MLASVLIIYLASCVIANGNIVTFQELVCQHCNELSGSNEAATQRALIGKAGPPGIPGPRGPSGQINETALRELVRYETEIGRKGINETFIREIVREEIELALKLFRNESKHEMERVTTSSTDTSVATNQWIVFQRRMDGEVNFYRYWNDYVNRFGNEIGEFWLGLEKIYQLTKSGDKELQINMITADGRHLTARYSHFQIGPASDHYRIQISGYSGNATDSFKIRQNKMKFSTRESDHDTASTNCAVQRKGGWWFSDCYTNLNGIFNAQGQEGIRWYDESVSNYIPMRSTEMKFRRRV